SRSIQRRHVLFRCRPSTRNQAAEGNRAPGAETKQRANRAVVAQRIQILIMRPLRLVWESFGTILLENDVVASRAGAPRRLLAEHAPRRAPHHRPGGFPCFLDQRIQALTYSWRRFVERVPCDHEKRR